MRVKALFGLGCGLALALSAAHFATGAPASAQAVVPFTASARVAQDYVGPGKVPGLVIAVGVGDAPAKFSYAGRVAVEPGASPVDQNSLWRVYSMTKPVTGIAAMILVEEGKIRLDQPVSDFIPAFRNMRVLDDPKGTTLASHPATHPITIRNLLTHTAGLGYDLGGQIGTTGPLLDAYRKAGINPAQINTQLETDLRAVRPPSLEAFANTLATMPLIAEPGTKWSYSIGLDLMGRVIEVASGMPFDTFLQKRIFDPLKMNSSYFTVPGSEVSRFATNYFFMGGTAVPADPAASSVWLKPPSFPYGGAGLVSSAYDYDRFLHMLLNGGTLDGVRILKPETVALAMSNLLPEGADASPLQGLGAFGGKMGFGAGGSVYLSDSGLGPSKGTYGWAGAAGTIAFVDPVRKVRGVLMVNYMPSEHFPLREAVTKAIYADSRP